MEILKHVRGRLVVMASDPAVGQREQTFAQGTSCACELSTVPGTSVCGPLVVRPTSILREESPSKPNTADSVDSSVPVPRRDENRTSIVRIRGHC